MIRYNLINGLKPIPIEFISLIKWLIGFFVPLKGEALGTLYPVASTPLSRRGNERIQAKMYKNEMILFFQQPLALAGGCHWFTPY